MKRLFTVYLRNGEIIQIEMDNHILSGVITNRLKEAVFLFGFKAGVVDWDVAEGYFE